MGLLQKMLFPSSKSMDAERLPLATCVCVALLTMKCRELKINFIEIIHALQSVEDQLVEINTTDYC